MSPLVRSRTSRLAAALIAGALGLSLGTTACAHGATPQPLPPGTTFVITGHGNGHGHGMSQWGAQGAALAGKNVGQIMAFYYPGTQWGTAAGSIRVRLTKDTSADVVVRARPKLLAHRVGGRTFRIASLRPRAKRWRIVPVAGGRSRLDFLTGRWHRFRTVKGDLEFRARDNGPLRLYLPHGSALYRGTLRAASPVPGRADRDTVNIVGLESYLRGVVPAEAYPSWKPAALQAQAVAARSYAAYQRATLRGGYFDVYDTSADQVYRGASAETASTDAAVRATARRIRTYRGRPAFTQFSASNGGYMLADGVHPYLVSKADPYDGTPDNPYRTWTKTVTLKQFDDRFPSYAPIADVRVTAYAPGAGHWVKTLTVTKADSGSSSDAVSGETVRSWLGMRTANFTLRTVTGRAKRKR